MAMKIYLTFILIISVSLQVYSRPADVEVLDNLENTLKSDEENVDKDVLNNLMDELNQQAEKFLIYLNEQEKEVNSYIDNLLQDVSNNLFGEPENMQRKRRDESSSSTNVLSEWWNKASNKFSELKTNIENSDAFKDLQEKMSQVGTELSSAAEKLRSQVQESLDQAPKAS